MQATEFQAAFQSNDEERDDGYAKTRAMALNLAKWTYTSAGALGVKTSQNDCVWWRVPGGSSIYLGAVIVDGQRDNDAILSEMTAVLAAWGSESFHLYDCWATRDLSPLGFERLWTNPWYLRPPLDRQPLKEAASAIANGLTIEVVATAEELAEFEQASWQGFESEGETPEPTSWHAPATLEDPGMYYLIARVQGQVVASTIVYASEGMAGIYGISTLPHFRGRGYASALTRASLSLRPDLPMSVYPDPDSLPIYSRIGFERAGEIAVWQRTA